MGQVSEAAFASKADKSMIDVTAIATNPNNSVSGNLNDVAGAGGIRVALGGPNAIGSAFNITA
jgi:hypothetical protein